MPPIVILPFLAPPRPASLEVPTGDTMRGAIRAAAYTALPRFVLPEDEKIGHQKHLSYAHDTECRLPDGARIRIDQSMVILHPVPATWTRLNS